MASIALSSVTSKQWLPHSEPSLAHAWPMTRRPSRPIPSRFKSAKVTGDVNFSIEGEQGGTAATLNLSELLPEEASANWPFSFRYFQDFDKDIVLPDGFTPDKITIEVRSRTRSISSIEEIYSWTTSMV